MVNMSASEKHEKDPGSGDVLGDLLEDKQIKYLLQKVALTYSNMPVNEALERFMAISTGNMKEKVADLIKRLEKGGKLDEMQSEVVQRLAEAKTLEQGSVLEEFKEADEVKDIIDSITTIYTDQIAVERALERFLVVIDSYQEQPHLLDPHLECLITKLLNIAKDPKSPHEVVHLAFKLMYMITKTRGFKVVVRLMPHEVADLEPVLSLLDKQDPMDFQTWETRYMMLLWLSMVSMIPFDMSRLDSTARAQGLEGLKPTMDRIIDMGKKYINVSDKSRDAASYLLSRFMTRHDVREKRLAEYLDYSLVTLQQSADGIGMKKTMSLLGILRTLALLFKIGKREDFLSYASTVLNMVIRPDLNLKNSANTVVRKLVVKLIQRLGLTFLKARVATWRYQRGNRSLADNLSAGETVTQGVPAAQEEEEEEYDIPEEVEEVIEHLLTGLKDKDTIVRWSAAKGIGRVLGRLPKELADEVVGSIMEKFTIAEGDAAWHGACLALAELGRRGLLLPQRLPDVVPVIIKALNYDQMRGNFSVGAHVRDGACYVCWAFARAYDPEELKPHVKTIASALVIVSMFDREVNVRRAAAAAFQENVGRQGQFPHGIDILTTCDYFAVGNRNACYLNLSVYVAQFPEYTLALIDHLVQVKISHWDKSVRELTAEALYNLTGKAPQHMAQEVLPKVVAMATSMELNVRHGAILATACITHALYKLSSSGDPSLVERTKIDASTIENIKNISSKLHDGKLYLGAGGELMREAVCCLIKKASLSHFAFHNDPVLGLWQELLDDCLQHIQEEIRAAAIDAIPAFFTEYYREKEGKAKKEIQEKILTKYLAQLKANTEVARQGFALALGSLPAFMVQGNLDKVLHGLIQAANNPESKTKWAEAQRDAVKAITNLCLMVGVDKDADSNDCVCSGNVPQIYDAYFRASNDYTLDNRGDVGAWIREAAMTGMLEFTSMVVKKEDSLLSDDICRRLFCSLVQQSCEKIDRTRAHAGDIFITLLYHDPPLKKIPRKTDLQKIFKQSDKIEVNWAAPGVTFPKFTKLLALPEYVYHVLLGMTVSVGGLTESLVKYSSEALRVHLNNIMHDKGEIRDLASVVLKVFEDNQKVDRVTLPLLKMIDWLLSTGCFNEFLEEEGNTFGVDLYALSKQEINRCGEPQKLLASIDVFSCMLQFSGPVQKKIISQLMMFLCHRFPIIRKTTANKLYEAVVTFDDLVGEDSFEEVMSILSETQWDQSVDEVRPTRNKLCDMFGVAKPVTTKKNQGNVKAGAVPKK